MSNGAARIRKQHTRDSEAGRQKRTTDQETIAKLRRRLDRKTGETENLRGQVNSLSSQVNGQTGNLQLALADNKRLRTKVEELKAEATP